MSYQFKKREIQIIFVAKSFVFYCQLLRKNFKVVSFLLPLKILSQTQLHTPSQAVIHALHAHTHTPMRTLTPLSATHPHSRQARERRRPSSNQFPTLGNRWILTICRRMQKNVLVFAKTLSWNELNDSSQVHFLRPASFCNFKSDFFSKTLQGTSTD